MSKNPGPGQGRRRPGGPGWKKWARPPDLSNLSLDDNDDFSDARQTFAPVAEDIQNSITFIDDVISSPEATDGDLSNPSSGTFSFSSGRPPDQPKQPLQLTSLFGSADDSSSGDENSVNSPQYFNWGSPPPLDPFPEPSSSENHPSSAEANAGGPVHRGAVRELESADERTPTSSDKKPPKMETAPKLGSTAEKRRLQLYLKRIQEEGRQAQEKQEKPSTFVSGPGFSLAPPTPTETEAPQHFDLSDLDLEGEDLVFSPIHDGWGSQPSSKGELPVALNLPPRLPMPGETPRGSSSSAFMSQSQSKSQSKSQPQRQRTSNASPIERAVPARSPPRRPRLMRTLSITRSQRRTPSVAGAYAGAVRAASVQRGLQAGFDTENSRVTDLVVLGRPAHALECVAAACTEHLHLSVFMRKSGDKLRVEGRSAGRLRASLRFAEVAGVDPPRTLVCVRASRRDRSADADARIWDFFGQLATQLDIDGHLPADAGAIAASARGRAAGRRGRGRRR